MLTETNSGGTLNGLWVNNVYDSSLRRTTVEIKDGSTLLQGAGYAFGDHGRLQTVTDNSASSYTVAYAYEANSPLVSTITSKQSSTTRLVTTKKYDKLDRLTSISSAAAGSSAPALPISYAYNYNQAAQRVRVTQEDGSYWVYEYDALGQVSSGKRYWADGAAVDGQQFEYSTSSGSGTPEGIIFWRHLGQFGIDIWVAIPKGL